MLYVQSVRIIQCSICKMSYYFGRYMRSAECGDAVRLPVGLVVGLPVGLVGALVLLVPGWVFSEGAEVKKHRTEAP